MTTPVSFELAKLLKEKRFDLSTERFYPKPKCKLFGIDEYGKPYPIVNKTQTYFIGKAAVLKEENSYLAPTITEVVMWLYEKHKIWILALPTITGHFAYKIVDVQLNPGYPIERPPYNDVSGDDYDLPTEAYESAIEYALNNLL